jgi:hypothetical protein
VDIWDSKPLGLFLLYSAIRLLGGDGLLQYQIVATLFAVATAFVIYRAALRFASLGGAAAAAAAYLLFLPAFGGIGGQSQVFYNLIVAVAGLMTFRLVDPPPDAQPLPHRAVGMAIMILMGIGLQIKYSMVFEGIFFGLALLWRGWRSGRRLAALVLDASLWIACALLPTATLIAGFFAAGHGDAFMHGNFLSVLGREDPLLPSLGRLALSLTMLTPFWVGLLVQRRRRQNGAAPGFIWCWVAAAVGGYLLFGAYYDHYALPMLVPLSIAVAPVLGLGGDRRRFTVILLGAGLVMGLGKAILDRLERGEPAQIERMAALISSRNSGCLYVYEGNPALYRLTNACLGTRFAFPGHLSNVKSVNSMGFDVTQEVHEIMARAPGVVVTAEHPRSLSNLATRGALAAWLRRNYRHADTAELGRKRWMVFERVADGKGNARLPMERPGASAGGLW